MPTVLRHLVPVVFAVILLAALAPGPMAATTHPYPNQSLGNRGTDVRAIQGLLRAHGVAVANTGIFETTTRDAVMTFQSTHGLPADGVVRTTMWEKLIVPMSPGGSSAPSSSHTCR